MSPTTMCSITWLPKNLTRVLNPAQGFNYCNTNFVLLALIIEKISGKTFPAFMKENVFDPLQMKNTYVFSLADTANGNPVL